MTTIKKGGRPKKSVKRTEKMSAHCSSLERAVIEGRASSANLSVSEYIRRAALDAQIIVKSYPVEILKISSQLNQLAANTYNISKRMNLGQFLSPEDFEDISKLPSDFKNLSLFIKEKLK